MAPKRGASEDVGPTNKETPTRRITGPEKNKWTDTETGTLWKIVSPDRIRELLGKSPHECSMVKKLGLLDTFSIEYARPDWDMVKEYIRNFDEKNGWSKFQGRQLPFNIDVLRDAFRLPAGDPVTHKAHWIGPEIFILFAREKARGGKYCLDWLEKDYKHWEGPVRVVTELLLGRRRPSSVTGTIMWYFCCYLWEEFPESTKPAVMPDWARLMHEGLKNELISMREHLINGKPEPKKGKPPKNPPFYGCSAIMHLLLHLRQEPGTAPILKSVNAEKSVQADLGCSAAFAERPGVQADLGRSAASAAHPGGSQEERGRKRRAKREVRADTDDEQREVRQSVRREAQWVPEHAGGEGEEQSHSVRFVRREEESHSADEGSTGGLGCSASSAEHPGASRDTNDARSRIEQSIVLYVRDGSTQGGDAYDNDSDVEEGGHGMDVDYGFHHDIVEAALSLQLMPSRCSETVPENAAHDHDLGSRILSEKEVLVGEPEHARHASDAQVKLLQSQLSQQQTARDDAESVATQKLQSLQQELEKATKHAAEASKKAESLQETEQKMLQQKHELALKGERISELEKEVSVKGEENEKLQSRVNEQEEKFGELQSKVGELERARHALDAQVKLLQSQLSQQQTARDDAESVAKQELQSLQQEVEEATKHAAEASKKAESLQETEQKMLQQKHELALKGERISELEKEVSVKGEENEKLQSRVNEQEEKFGELQSKVGELERARHASDAQVKLLQSQLSQQQTARDVAESVAKQELQSLQQEVEEATKHAAGASKKVAEMQETGQGAQNELKILQQEHELALNKNSSLQSELDAKKAVVQRVGVLEESMERVRKEHGEALRAKAAAESELKRTRISLHDSHTKNAANGRKIREQSEEITRLKLKHSEAETKYKTVSGLLGDLYDEKASEETIAAIAKEEADHNRQKATKGAQQANIPTSTIRPTNHASTSSRPEMHTEQEASDHSGSESAYDEDGSDVTLPMPTDNEAQINMSGSDLVEEAEPPDGHLVVTPKGHQKKGLAWMIKRESTDTRSPRGGLLADDQGMGKTLQAIMLILSERPRPCSTLVLCLVGLLKQWVQEINNMCGPLAEIKALIYHGSGRNKPAPPRFEEYDVVVTSYATLESEWEKHKMLDGDKDKISQLLTMDWYRLILDEAHVIKNRNAKGSLAAFSVKAQTRWCLTGTPLQNKVADVFSFFKVLGYDQIEDYERDFKPLENRCKKWGMAELRSHLARFTLRRMKGLLGLPLKECKIIEVDFAEASHRELYESIMDKSSTAWMQAKAKGAKNNSCQTFGLLLKCRRACVDPSLVTSAQRSPATERTEKDLSSLLTKVASTEKCNACQEEITDVTDGVYISETCQHVYCEACFCDFSSNSEEVECRANRCRETAVLISVEEIIPMPAIEITPQRTYAKPSSKVEAVMAYLKELPPLSNEVASDNGYTEKVILFSQWTSALSLVQERFDKCGVTYEKVVGAMRIKTREEALRAFSNKPEIKVLLLSLKACNVGLNIVAANHVILLDGWWNPTVEDQAVDRCYRIGQTRPVTVVRLVVKRTIEQRILKLQDQKRELHTSILSDKISEAPKKRQSKKDQLVSALDYLINGEQTELDIS